MLLLLAAITQILMVSCSHEQMIMMILRLRTIVARLQNPLKSEQSLYQSVALMATLAQMTNVWPSSSAYLKLLIFSSQTMKVLFCKNNTPLYWFYLSTFSFENESKIYFFSKSIVDVKGMRFLIYSQISFEKPRCTNNHFLFYSNNSNCLLLKHRFYYLVWTFLTKSWYLAFIWWHILRSNLALKNVL